MTIELGRATGSPSSANNSYGYAILGLDELEFKSEYKKDNVTGISTWENLIGPFQNKIPNLSTQWSGWYVDTENLSLISIGSTNTTVDDFLGFRVNDGQSIQFDNQLIQSSKFDPQTSGGTELSNDIWANELTVNYYNQGGPGQLRDLSVSIDNYYPSILNAIRLGLNGGEINIPEPKANTISELFTIHSDAYGIQTVHLTTSDKSQKPTNEVATDGFTRARSRSSALGDDYNLFWGASGLTNPTKADLTWIDPTSDQFTWTTSGAGSYEQNASNDYQQISIYAELLSDSFAEQNQEAVITAWGGAGKTTYEWTWSDPLNGGMWKTDGTWNFYGNLETYSGGHTSGPYADGGSGSYLNQTLNLQGYGGRVEFDVFYGDSWDPGEHIQVYANGNLFDFEGTTTGGQALKEVSGSRNGYTATLKPYNDFANNIGAGWTDQSARIVIDVPVGVKEFKLGIGETLDQAWNDEFLGIDNLSVIEPEVTTYTLNSPDNDPFVSLGRTGYLDSDNSFIDTDGVIEEGSIGVVEILISDQAGNPIAIENPSGLYVHYTIEATKAEESKDYFTSKGVMSTQDYKVENFIKLDPGATIGYLYITAPSDSIVEEGEMLKLTLLNNGLSTDTGYSYRNYVVEGNISTNVKLEDPSNQPWVKAIAITQQGRTDSYVRANQDGVAQLDIKLKSTPEDTINIKLPSGDLLTFNKQNWQTPQNIAITLDDNKSGGSTLTLASDDDAWIGNVLIDSYFNPTHPSIVLYEGGSTLEEGNRVALSGSSIVEGASASLAPALTMTRVSQDNSSSFEVFFNTDQETDGSNYSNPAIFEGDQIKRYQPLAINSDSSAQWNNIRTDQSSTEYTIEFWINPQDLNQTSTPIHLSDGYGRNIQVNLDSTGIVELRSDSNVFLPSIQLNQGGDKSFLQGEAPTGLPVGNESYTIQAWIKAKGIMGNGGILAWGQKSKSQMNALRTLNDSFFNYHWSNDLQSQPANYYDNQWHQITATYDAETNNNSIYIDGEVIGTKKLSPLNMVETEIFVGRTLLGEYFQGSLSDVKIWNQALNATEVAASFANSAIKTEALIGSYLASQAAPLTNTANKEQTALDTLTVVGDTEISTRVISNSTTTLRSETPVRINNWQHIAIERTDEGNLYQLYINGKASGSIEAPSDDLLTLGSNTFDVSVGGDGNALIRDLKIINRAESNNELLRDMLGSEIAQNQLIFEAKLNGSLEASTRETTISETNGIAKFSTKNLFGALFESGTNSITAYLNNKDNDIAYGKTVYNITVSQNSLYSIVGEPTVVTVLNDNDISQINLYKENAISTYALLNDSTSKAQLKGSAVLIGISNSDTAGLNTLSTAVEFDHAGGLELPALKTSLIQDGITLQGWYQLDSASTQNLFSLLNESGYGIRLSTKVGGSVELITSGILGTTTYITEAISDLTEWNHWSLSLNTDGLPTLFLNGDAVALSSNDIETSEQSLFAEDFSENWIGKSDSQGGNSALDDSIKSKVAGFRAFTGVRDQQTVQSDISNSGIHIDPQLIYSLDLSASSINEGIVSIDVIALSTDIERSWASLSGEITLSQPKSVNNEGYIINTGEPISLSLGVALNSEPEGQVIIYIDETGSILDPDYIVAVYGENSVNSLIFTKDNWNIPQEIIVKTTGTNIPTDIQQKLVLSVDDSSEDKNYKGQLLSTAISLIASLPTQKPEEASGTFTASNIINIGSNTNLQVSESDDNNTILPFYLTNQDNQTAISAHADTVVLLGKNGRSSANMQDINIDASQSNILSGLVNATNPGTTKQRTSILPDLENVAIGGITRSITGFVEIQQDGYYTFYGQSNSAIKVLIDHNEVLNIDSSAGHSNGYSNPILLKAGDYVPISIEATGTDEVVAEEQTFTLQWIQPNNQDGASTITGLSRVNQTHVVIPAGQSAGNLAIRAVNDMIAEKIEDFRLEVEQEQPYELEIDTSQIQTTEVGSLVLEDSSSYISLPAITLGTSYTIGGWIKPDSLQSVQTFFYADSGVTNQSRISLRSTPAGAIQFGSWDSNKQLQYQFESANNIIDAGDWQYVAVSVSADQSVIYVNGEAVATQSLENIETEGARSRVKLGSGANANEALIGAIRDYKLFNKALDATTILKIYEGEETEAELINEEMEDWYPLNTSQGNNYDSQDGSKVVVNGRLVGNAITTSESYLSFPLTYQDGPTATYALRKNDQLILIEPNAENNDQNWTIQINDDVELLQGVTTSTPLFTLTDSSDGSALPGDKLLSSQRINAAYQLPVMEAIDADGKSYESIDESKILVDISILDNDTAGFAIEDDNTGTVAESGGSITKSIKLQSKPLDSVTVFLQPTVDDQIKLITSDGSNNTTSEKLLYLTFTEENWDTPQQFIIEAVDNLIADGERTIDIHLTSSSDDPEYYKLSSLTSPQSVEALSITVNDNDTAGISYATIDNNVQESSNGYVFITLSSQPTSEVLVTATPKDSSFSLSNRGNGKPGTLTFTEENWSIPQSLELIAQENNAVTGTVLTALDWKVSSEQDISYTDALKINPLDVYIVDNDIPTAKIVPVLDATENASPGAFKIVLDNPAPADDGSTGIEVGYTINGFNLDQALQSIKLSNGSEQQFYITDENGNFDTNASTDKLLDALGIYTMSPGGESLYGQVRIAPGETESKVFVIPIDDQVADDYSLDTATSQTGKTGKRILYSLTQNTGETPLVFSDYRISNKNNEQQVSIDIINNDIPGVAIISSGSLIQTSEDDGASNSGAEFAVVLLSEPKGDVSITIDEVGRNEAQTITGDDQDYESNEQELSSITNKDGEGITSNDERSLLFTGANWYTPQTVVIVANPDEMIEDGANVGYQETGIHSTKIKLTFESDADEDYDGASHDGDSTYFANNTSLDVLVLDQSLPKTTADSIASALDNLQAGFENLELPLLGKMNGKIGNPFDDIYTTLVPQIRALGNELTTSRLQKLLNTYFGSDNVNVTLPIGGQFIGVDFGWDQDYDLLSIPLDGKLGIPALGIQSNGSVDSSISLGTKLGLNIPFSTEELDISLRVDSESTGINADLGIELSDNFSLSGGLGFLQFEATNQISDQTGESTGLSSQFAITLDANSDELISLSDLLNPDFNFNDHIKFTFPTDAGASNASLSLHVNTQSSLGAVMPAVDFNLSTKLPVFNYADADQASTTDSTVFINDINLDIGSFATEMLLPTVQVIGDVLNPIRPLVDAFYTDTKIFSSLGMSQAMDSDGDGIVTPLDMLIVYANTFGTSADQKNAQKAKTFLSTLKDVYSVINTFETLEDGQEFSIDLGNYNFDLAAASKDSNQSSSKKNIDTSSLATNTKTKALSANERLGSAINKLYSLGFSIPLIESPSTAVSLLMGKEVDLFRWIMPGMSASLNPSQTFNLYPAPLIQGTIGGKFGAEAFIELGFDTSGFSDWANSGFNPDEAWRAFDGFFVSDWDSNGVDRNEATISADLGVDVSASVALAKATAGGGVRATMGFDLIDNGEFNGTSDGKLRASEIFPRLSNPLNLFDLTGDLSAYLDGSVKVGFDFGFYKKWWKVWSTEFDFDLFSFELSSSGGHSNGPIAGSTVFFDANRNNKIDPSEASTVTLEDGTYSDLSLDMRAIDVNHNNVIDTEEGRLIAFGGQDTVGNIEIRSVMSAPYGKQINPLTTLYGVALDLSLDGLEAKTKIQKLFNLSDWDFSDLDPTKILEQESVDTSISQQARKAAIAHTFLNWSLSRLIKLYENRLGSSQASLDARINVTKIFLEKILLNDANVSAAEKIASSLSDTLADTASGKDQANDAIPSRAIVNNQVAFIETALQNSLLDSTTNGDFIEKMAAIKSLFLRPQVNSQSPLPQKASQNFKVINTFDFLSSASQSVLSNQNVQLSELAIDFSIPVSPDISRVSSGFDLSSVTQGLELSKDGVAIPNRHLTYYSLYDSGEISPLTYNPSLNGGARFYDLNGNDGVADFMSLTLSDGGYGDKDGIINGIIDDPSTAGIVDLSPQFIQHTPTILQVVDPTNNLAPAALTLQATLKGYANTVNQVSYVILEANEIDTAGKLLTNLDSLKGRAQTLFSTLEATDRTVPEDTQFLQDVVLINGQSICFFETTDATLDQIKVISDNRLKLLTSSTDDNDDPAPLFRSKSGVEFSIELLNSQQGVNALLGQEQSKAPVIDCSLFTSDQTLHGSVLMSREATLDSLTGFYRTLDPEGAVLATNGTDVLRPGDLGYSEAALRPDNIVDSLSNLAVGDDQISSTPFTLKESSYLAPFSIIGSNKFFAYASANQDLLSHFVNLGNNTFGMEDTLGGGDLDYDDLVLKLLITELS